MAKLDGRNNNKSEDVPQISISFDYKIESGSRDEFSVRNMVIPRYVVNVCSHGATMIRRPSRFPNRATLLLITFFTIDIPKPSTLARGWCPLRSLVLITA
jgi:hypothetical protein